MQILTTIIITTLVNEPKHPLFFYSFFSIAGDVVGINENTILVLFCNSVNDYLELTDLELLPVV